jgi:nitrogen fixation/metabolism regulation signal transduction histidine kinase
MDDLASKKNVSRRDSNVKSLVKNFGKMILQIRRDSERSTTFYMTHELVESTKIEEPETALVVESQP